MMQIDTNIQELPQKRNPKAVLEGQIQENTMWIAQVLGSRLYQKRGNIREIRTTFAEVLELIEDWHRDWNPDSLDLTPSQAPKEEDDDPTLNLAGVHPSWWTNVDAPAE